MAKSRETSVPKSAQPFYDTIVAITDAFSQQHLNEEYAQMCRQMAAALARKRPSPLARGKPHVWAAGIIHAIGSVNFLFDRSQTPHVRSDQLSKWLGVNQTTTSSKSKWIRDLFHIHVLEPEWTLPSKIGDNPLVWLISVNGLPMDARYAPREIQEEAFLRGLIPYIPE